MQKKKIILSAGGTGGHLFPAQALAESLTEHEVLFVAGGLRENRFFDRSQFSFEEISAATFSFSKPLQLIRGSGKILKGVQRSRRIIRSFNPDLVVGFGSFYTLPMLIAALTHNIPIVLHEQNAEAGKVNRLFSRFAHTTALTFPLSLPGRTELTRFPMQRRSKEDPWEYFGLKKGRPTLLVFGGSQGAERLNSLFLEALPLLPHVQVLHFTGKKSAAVEKIYRELAIPHCVKPFEPKLHLALEIADLAITRAGAATIAELTETKTPAILIPFPFATDNHQEKNGRHFLGGELFREKDLTAEKLAHAIRHFPLEEKKKLIEPQKERRTLSDLIQDVINHG